MLKDTYQLTLAIFVLMHKIFTQYFYKRFSANMHIYLCNLFACYCCLIGIWHVHNVDILVYDNTFILMNTIFFYWPLYNTSQLFAK